MYIIKQKRGFFVKRPTQPRIFFLYITTFTFSSQFLGRQFAPALLFPANLQTKKTQGREGGREEETPPTFFSVDLIYIRLGFPDLNPRKLYRLELFFRFCVIFFSFWLNDRVDQFTLIRSELLFFFVLFDDTALYV